ncbi:MAG: hypothetical protein JRN15_20775 [Nitrososphaerota archaeon]|nr:hypothetical protein [Nitrososphaerota archaeon]
MIVFPEAKNMFDLYEKFKLEQWTANELDYEGDGQTGDITGDYGTSWIDLSRLPSLQTLDKRKQDEFVSKHSWLALCTSIQAEDFAARLCGSELEEIPDKEARMALAMQTVDEERHHEVGMRILSNRYHDKDFVYVKGREERWKNLIGQEYMRKLIGFHIVTEGLAMGRFRNRELKSPDPVIREMYRRINFDEARHTAIGMLYVSHRVKSMTEGERHSLEDYTFEKVLEDYITYTDRMFSKDICNEAGIDHTLLVSEMNDLGVDRIVRVELNRRVMPKIKQIGLLSDRVLSKYKQHGFYVDNDQPPTALMR